MMDKWMHTDSDWGTSPHSLHLHVFISSSLQKDAEKCCTDPVFWNDSEQQRTSIYTHNRNNSILDANSVRICSDNYLFFFFCWQVAD